VRLEGLRQSIKKLNDLIGNRTLDLPSRSIAPQLLRYRVFLKIEFLIVIIELMLFNNAVQFKRLICVESHQKIIMKVQGGQISIEAIVAYFSLVVVIVRTEKEQRKVILRYISLLFADLNLFNDAV
jgi:hypothetical protein